MATKRDFITTYGLQSDKSGVGSNTLVVDSVNDRVGIGITNPSYKLHTIGNIKASTSLHFGTGGTYEAGTIYSDSNWGVIIRALQASPVSADFLFTNSADLYRLKIDTSGNVIIPGTGSATGTASQPLQVTGGAYVSGNLGLGVTAPSFKADIAGDARITSTNRLRFGGTTATTNFYIQYNSTANSLDFVAG